MIIVLDFLTQYLQYDRRREMFLFSSEMCVNRVIQLLVLLIVYSYCFGHIMHFQNKQGRHIVVTVCCPENYGSWDATRLTRP